MKEDPEIAAAVNTELVEMKCVLTKIDPENPSPTGILGKHAS
jgi:hypothetical protein